MKIVNAILLLLVPSFSAMVSAAASRDRRRDWQRSHVCYPNTEETDVTAAFHARLGAVFYREGTMPPAVIPGGREDGAEATPTPSATGTPAP